MTPNKLFITDHGDFPGGPVVKTLPFRADGMGSILGQELRFHMIRGGKKNQQNNHNLKQKQYCIMDHD